MRDALTTYKKVIWMQKIKILINVAGIRLPRFLLLELNELVKIVECVIKFGLLYFNCVISN
jgi:hypothetical protein